MPTTLSILVFVASPLDYARYRHTALFFDFNAQSSRNSSSEDEDQIETAVTDSALIQKTNTLMNRQDARPEFESDNANIKSSLMEVIGERGFFNFTERVNSAIPVSSTDLAHIIPVSTLEAAPPSALRLITSDTLIPSNASDEQDWNSQNWVGDALGRLVKAGYLDAGDRDRALDEMVDAVLEAGDEEVVSNG
ncbi:hypothetical protein N7532_001675 [Penicillium argentinense]|uniref:Uncharacterized protein n=1 Tax=Penicillium argentinense TaxID=1131581 RepID=A0A9W9G3V6_9EURO|nr:uncharacterized protein N7532_001675 [Penicillium argentinense]KAJ5111140.1 hypothetical protein N7532_001675 [Penicillium argentinense]